MVRRLARVSRHERVHQVHQQQAGLLVDQIVALIKVEQARVQQPWQVRSELFVDLRP